jgi:hypothetical protein
MRRKNIVYFTLSIAITIGIILIGVFCYKTSFLRLFESLSNLYLSVKYYFCQIFRIGIDFEPTVASYSKVFEWTTYLPSDFDNFEAFVKSYFELLFSQENLIEYLRQTVTVICAISKIGMLIIPCLVVIWFAIKRIYNNGNTKHNVDTNSVGSFQKNIVDHIRPNKAICFVLF